MMARIDKPTALKALDTLDGIIDDELNTIEKSMAIIQQFIEQEEK